MDLAEQTGGLEPRWPGLFASLGLPLPGLAVLAALLVSCSSGPTQDVWLGQFVGIATKTTDPNERAPLYLALAEVSSGRDKCQALVEAAREFAHSSDRERTEQTAHLAASLGYCGDSVAEAQFVLANMELARGDLNGASRIWDLAQTWPWTYWASAGLWSLWDYRRLLREYNIEPTVFFARLYDAVKEGRLAGQVAWLHGLAHIERYGEIRGQPPESWLILIYWHSDSPLWDDALLAVADNFADAGLYSEEAKVLELALLPGRNRDETALRDGFTQAVRYRLASVYYRQGRSADALYQLGLVINFHDQLSLKDEALWKAAQIYRANGDRDQERSALQTLTTGCPWSSHSAEAAERLRALANGSRP